MHARRKPKPVAGTTGRTRRAREGGKTHGLDKLPPKDEPKPKPKERVEGSGGGTGFVPSRKEVTLVNVNVTGNTFMNFVPRHKILMLIEYLQKSEPDAVFIQDAFETEELASILEEASHGCYDYHLQDKYAMQRKEKPVRGGGSDDEMDPGHSTTGIAWNRNVYFGTPLHYDDDRLADFVGWLKKHYITVVKLDSKERNGNEDVYPSFIAISWHGPDYETPLRQRTKVCEEFFTFLMILREKNWHIPIVIGGDFNMDMKSFNMKPFPHFALVPYRPISGSLAKDLKNTFMFTVDTMQVTETSFKQHHPDVYACPFITCKVRGRVLIKIWAVRRIQKNIRLYLQRKRAKERARQKNEDVKSRWTRKIQADSQVPQHVSRKKDPSPERPKRETKAEKEDVVDDRRFKLYWDETLDPNYKPPELTPEEQAQRRRKDFNDDKTNVINEILEPKVRVGGNFRRRRFHDLKSVQDRKKEEEENYW